MKTANRTFIVSGGSSGLGLECVRDLVRGDAYVAVLDLRPPPSTWSTFDPSEYTSSQPSSSPSSLPPQDRLLYLETDVTKPEQIEDAVENAVAWSKRTGAVLGGIINCAGMGKAEPLIDRNGNLHRVSTWDYAVAVNLSGTFHLTRLGIKHLRTVEPEGEDGERGVVIMVSSEVSFDGQPGTLVYAATKGALNAMTLPMARDCARWGIRVVTLAPGVFATALTAAFPQRVKDNIQKFGLLHPRRWGKPKEFANTVRWVLETAFINGEVIRLTGGGRVPSRL